MGSVDPLNGVSNPTFIDIFFLQPRHRNRRTHQQLGRRKKKELVDNSSSGANLVSDKKKPSKWAR